jgi:ornithine cyclodeaminase
MATIRVLTEADLREAVGLGAEELDAIESVFPLITSGVGSMPPIMHIDVPEKNGEIDIKAAYLPGYSGIAVKVSAGFFDNPDQGLPSLGGLMMVFDVETGIPRAALFDNGYLTNIRTALAGAVAARHLANENASTAAVFGAGVQARLQLEALMMVRHIQTALVWARNADQAEVFARDMTSRLGIPVEVSPSREAAVAGADMLVTTTPSTEPLVEASMLHPGLHVTAMGSDAPTKQEVSSGALAGADGFFCDSVKQSERLGELRAAIAAGFDGGRAVELGAVVAGDVPGRRSPDDTTVCDLTGTGAQDTAIASLAVDRCDRSGAGIGVET